MGSDEKAEAGAASWRGGVWRRACFWAALACLCAAPAAARTQKEGVSPDVVLQLQTRIDDLELLVRDLTGKLEEAQYRDRQLQAQVDRLARDLEWSLKRQEQNKAADAEGGGFTPSLSAGPGETKAGETGTGEAKTGETETGVPPEERYRQAYDLLRLGKYKQANEALQSFLKAYPTHELAGNAQYWLGETYYVQGDFKSASVAFLDGYRIYPKSVKAPDNLLKLGLSMERLGKIPEACAALNRIGAEYPGADETVRMRAVQDAARLKCPRP